MNIDQTLKYLWTYWINPLSILGAIGYWIIRFRLPEYQYLYPYLVGMAVIQFVGFIKYNIVPMAKMVTQNH